MVVTVADAGPYDRNAVRTLSDGSRWHADETAAHDSVLDTILGFHQTHPCIVVASKQFFSWRLGLLNARARLESALSGRFDPKASACPVCDFDAVLLNVIRRRDVRELRHLCESVVLQHVYTTRECETEDCKLATQQAQPAHALLQVPDMLRMARDWEAEAVVSSAASLSSSFPRKIAAAGAGCDLSAAEVRSELRNVRFPDNAWAKSRFCSELDETIRIAAQREGASRPLVLGLIVRTVSCPDLAREIAQRRAAAGHRPPRYATILVDWSAPDFTVSLLRSTLAVSANKHSAATGGSVSVGRCTGRRADAPAQPAAMLTDTLKHFKKDLWCNVQAFEVQQALRAGLVASPRVEQRVKTTNRVAAATVGVHRTGKPVERLPQLEDTGTLCENAATAATAATARAPAPAPAAESTYSVANMAKRALEDHTKKADTMSPKLTVLRAHAEWLDLPPDDIAVTLTLEPKLPTKPVSPANPTGGPRASMHVILDRIGAQLPNARVGLEPVLRGAPQAPRRLRVQPPAGQRDARAQLCDLRRYGLGLV